MFSHICTCGKSGVVGLFSLPDLTRLKSRCWPAGLLSEALGESAPQIIEVVCELNLVPCNRRTEVLLLCWLLPGGSPQLQEVSCGSLHLDSYISEAVKVWKILSRLESLWCPHLSPLSSFFHRISLSDLLPPSFLSKGSCGSFGPYPLHNLGEPTYFKVSWLLTIIRSQSPFRAVPRLVSDGLSRGVTGGTSLKFCIPQHLWIWTKEVTSSNQNFLVLLDHDLVYLYLTINISPNWKYLFNNSIFWIL